MNPARRPGLKVHLSSCKFDVIRDTAEKLGYEVAEEEVSQEQWHVA